MTREIIGYTCPNCNTKWSKGKPLNQCPTCGKTLKTMILYMFNGGIK